LWNAVQDKVWRSCVPVPYYELATIDTETSKQEVSKLWRPYYTGGSSLIPT